MRKLPITRKSFPTAFLTGIVVVIILLIAFAARSFFFVPSGKVGVIHRFGVVQTSEASLTAPGGPYFLMPGHSVTLVDTNSHTLEITSANIGKVSDKDDVPIDFDTTVPYAVNPDCAGMIVAKGGIDKIHLLLSSTGPTAMRDAASKFTWEEMQTEKRVALSSEIKNRLDDYIQSNLIDQGYPPALARHCVSIYRVQLQSIQPPEKVRDALSEKASANIRSQTQDILTSIANQEAARRTSEGDGIKNVMDALKGQYSAKDILLVTQALAMKEQADALERAVREGKINLMVIPSTSPVSLSHNTPE